MNKSLLLTLVVLACAVPLAAQEPAPPSLDNFDLANGVHI